MIRIRTKRVRWARAARTSKMKKSMKRRIKVSTGIKQTSKLEVTKAILRTIMTIIRADPSKLSLLLRERRITSFTSAKKDFQGKL